MTGLDYSIIIVAGLIIPATLGLGLITFMQSHYTASMAKFMGALITFEIILLFILGNV